MYNNDAQRCLTGEVRLSYVNLDKPRQPQGGVGDAKYSATLLIPKTDTATIADFRAAIQAAAQIGAGTLWGGIIPPNLDSIIHDGDGVRPSGIPFGDECHGCWVITASSKNKPQVVGQDNINVISIHALLAESDPILTWLFKHKIISIHALLAESDFSRTVSFSA